MLCRMAATNRELANAARESLARILATDTAEWSEGQRKQRQLEITELRHTIKDFEAEAARESGRRILQPVRRVCG